jgi:hypothetical protein
VLAFVFFSQCHGSSLHLHLDLHWVAHPTKTAVDEPQRGLGHSIKDLGNVVTKSLRRRDLGSAGALPGTAGHCRGTAGALPGFCRGSAGVLPGALRVPRALPDAQRST